MKTTYYLLQPKATDVEPEYLRPGEIVAILDQGRWSEVTLVSKSEAYHPTHTWRYRIMADNDVEYKRMLFKAKKDWGVMRGGDWELELNSPRIKVEVPTGQRSRLLVVSVCESCCGRTIMAYEEECKDLGEQLPVDCKHNKPISEYVQQEESDGEEMATLRPRMP